MGEFKSVLKIIDIEYIDDVYTFVVTLANNAQYKCSLERETNRLR